MRRRRRMLCRWRCRIRLSRGRPDHASAMPSSIWWRARFHSRLPQPSASTQTRHLARIGDTPRLPALPALEPETEAVEAPITSSPTSFVAAIAAVVSVAFHADVGCSVDGDVKSGCLVATSSCFSGAVVDLVAGSFPVHGRSSCRRCRHQVWDVARPRTSPVLFPVEPKERMTPKKRSPPWAQAC